MKKKAPGESLDLAVRRARQGISLEQVAESTKISLRLLRAIESLDFGKLPGGIYSTNYIRQYARCVHCDESELLDAYYAKVGGLPQDGSVARPQRGGLLRLFTSSWATHVR